MAQKSRRSAALLAASAAVVLGPVLLAGPASASGTLPDEPPGGATCAPEVPATDCQQEPPGPTPTPSPTKATTQGNPQNIPSTGGSKPAGTPALAHTGSTQTMVFGFAGGTLLLLGSGLVLAGRRTERV